MIVDSTPVKIIPNFPTYAISRNGRVRSIHLSGRGSTKEGKWLKPGLGKNGYLLCVLCEGSIRFSRTIHRLVLETYVGPCPEGMECRHLNGLRTDNRLENLCWGTRSENRFDAVKHGTLVDNRGEKSVRAKLTNDQIPQIYHRYHDKINTQKELAELFGVSHCRISRIVNRKDWTFVKI